MKAKLGFDPAILNVQDFSIFTLGTWKEVFKEIRWSVNLEDISFSIWNYYLKLTLYVWYILTISFTDEETSHLNPA